MPLAHHEFVQPRHEQTPLTRRVRDLAADLRTRLDSPASARALDQANNDYDVPALRPDFYLELEDTGVLLEVERGKTLKNNMDLLDLWKCHICSHASYLFMCVPQRVERSYEKEKPYDAVLKRMESFFRDATYTGVWALHVFGY